MNKYLVEKYIEFAYESMKNNKDTSIKGQIAISSGSILSAKRQIATLGAAISSGSILSAIAFFSNPPTKKSNNNQDTKTNGQTTPTTQENEPTDNVLNSDKAKEDAKGIRIYLLNRIYDVVHENKPEVTLDKEESKTRSLLFNYVLGEIKAGYESEVTEKVLSAAIAVKLALNLFE